jgi:hypothetical protein
MHDLYQLDPFQGTRATAVRKLDVARISDAGATPIEQKF